MGIEAWNREDIPYDAMGDYSGFRLYTGGREEVTCSDQDRTGFEETD